MQFLQKTLLCVATFFKTIALKRMNKKLNNILENFNQLIVQRNIDTSAGKVSEQE